MNLVRRLAVDVTPLRESPGFRRLWVGQSIAYVAWRMMLVLVPVQVYRLTGSTLDVGLLALVQFLPLASFTILLAINIVQARSRKGERV